VVEIGYALSSEEHSPADLVRFACMAEETGFRYAMISDHYLPWTNHQGQSPFVWSVTGAIAQATQGIKIGTGVTCPMIRYHPAIIAQAAATMGCLMPGRFMLGVGTGENLNEHVVGAAWPSYDIRADMLREAVEIIRLLWEGRTCSYHGQHYEVDNARVYSLPDQLPPIIVAAGGPKSARMAAELGDGLINYSPDPQITEIFESSGGSSKPRYIQYNVCWAKDEAEARRTALETTPTVALQGELGNLLPTPKHYEQAVQMITEDAIAEVIVCGPDPQKHIEGLQKCIDARYDHVHVDQVGPDQDGFFRFYQNEVLPHFKDR
jgi:coenzyme F420-dependent glucose-6-phosphate dehydrogenase